MRKAVLQLSMHTGTSIGYFRSMTLRDFLQTVKDFIEISEQIAQYRKEAFRRRR